MSSSVFKYIDLTIDNDHEEVITEIIDDFMLEILQENVEEMLNIITVEILEKDPIDCEILDEREAMEIEVIQHEPVNNIEDTEEIIDQHESLEDEDEVIEHGEMQGVEHQIDWDNRWELENWYLDDQDPLVEFHNDGNSKDEVTVFLQILHLSYNKQFCVEIHIQHGQIVQTKNLLYPLPELQNLLRSYQNYFQVYPSLYWVSHQMVTPPHLINLQSMVFPCEKCDKVFFSFDIREKHTSTHESSRFVCEVPGCTIGKIYCSQARLSDHITAFHLKIPQTCDQCSKTYAHMTNLYRHKKTAHGYVRM